MENINYELLGKRIRNARKKMGLTQAELGAKVVRVENLTPGNRPYCDID